MIKPRVVSKQGVLAGKPVIAGTRISVELVMDLLAAGLTVDQIREQYPHLTKGQIQAAVEYAASVMRREMVVPIESKNGKIVFRHA